MVADSGIPVMLWFGEKHFSPEMFAQYSYKIQATSIVVIYILHVCNTQEGLDLFGVGRLYHPLSFSLSTGEVYREESRHSAF